MKLRNVLWATALTLSAAAMPAAALIQPAPVEAATIIAPAAENHTYDVFQIFTGDVLALENNETGLKNIKWGQNALDSKANVTVGEQVPDSVIELLQSVQNKTQAEKLQVIEQFVNFSSTPVASLRANDKSGNLPSGYYLIRDNVTNGTNTTASLFVTTIVSDNQELTITPKTGQPTFEKKVQDINDSESKVPTGWQDSADYDFGDMVPFQLSALLPENYSAYKSYTLKFNDSFSTKSFSAPAKSEIRVYIEGTDGEKELRNDSFNVTDPVVDNAKDTTSFTVEIPNLKNAFYTDGTKVSTGDELNGKKVYVRYSAQLLPTADLGTTQSNKNTANLEYSNNPNTGHAGDLGKTPDDTVRVFTFQIKVTKVDNERNPLEGAEFTLYKQIQTNDGKQHQGTEGMIYYKEVATIKNPTGEGKNIFTFKGLDDGKYYLVESKVPTGYAKMDDISFTINASHDENSSNPQLIQVTVPGGQLDVDANNNMSTTVINLRQGSLPSTGGMGTTVLYAVGGVLVVGAGIAYVTKKRMDKEDRD